MNRHNAKLNAFALQQLQLTGNDRVLEIGFGGGVALPTLIGVAAFVGGVDRSREMVDRAKARFAAAVAADRADFREGTVDAIPFETASFSKACSVNTIYFWRSLDAGFAEVRRVLSPISLVVVGFLPKEHMDRGNFPADIFTSRTPDKVMRALRAPDFRISAWSGPRRTLLGT